MPRNTTSSISGTIAATASSPSTTTTGPPVTRSASASSSVAPAASPSPSGTRTSADAVAPLVLPLLQATSRALQAELRAQGAGRAPAAPAHLLLTGRRTPQLLLGKGAVELSGRHAELIAADFPADMGAQGITGHSMGGHGALTVGPLCEAGAQLGGPLVLLGLLAFLMLMLSRHDWWAGVPMGFWSQ